jgi:hypothetical protein
MLDQLLEQEVRAQPALLVDHGAEGIEPLAGFLGVGVLGGEAARGLRHGGHRCLLWMNRIRPCRDRTCEVCHMMRGFSNSA